MRTCRNDHKFRLMLAMVVLFFFVSFSSLIVRAEEMDGEKTYPTAMDNMNDFYLRKSSFLISTETGYMRLYHKDKTIYIEYFDESFNVLKKMSIDMELDLWGGFYAGEGAYYVMEGQICTEENQKKEAIRVIKYDLNWSRLGAASIYSGEPTEIMYPFDYGSGTMAEKDGFLYVGTARECDHQGLLLLRINEETMEGEVYDCDYWHSFAQYVQTSDSTLYLLEQSDGNRCTQLTAYDLTEGGANTIPVLKYGGTHTSSWAIACYSSVDDIAISDDCILGLGTSIDQSLYDQVNSDVAHNVYLTVTPKNDFTAEKTEVKWFTDHKDDGNSFAAINITKISGDRFLLMWQEFEDDYQLRDLPDSRGKMLHYIFVDGHGNAVSKEYVTKADLSECHPILNGSKVVWYASTGNKVEFYQIDTVTEKLKEKVYQVAGEHALWDIKDGVLTITGTGEIDIEEYYHRFFISSTSGGGTEAHETWEDQREKITKIVIAEGITSIAEDCFSGFEALEEVDIGSTVKSIGECAFRGAENLGRVYIRSKKVSIGSDAFWSGWYSYYGDSHIVYATLYCPKGSNVVDYAKENGISYAVVRFDENGNVITGPQYENGKWYLYDEYGAEITDIGWVTIGDKTYYREEDGSLKTGWLTFTWSYYYETEEENYYFDKNGVLQTGWLLWKKKYYYLDPESNGLMITDWKKIDGKWYYFNKNGARKTGWLNYNGKWYFFGNDGVMRKNWIKSGGKWYFMGSDGAMKTGWIKYKGQWYFIRSSGEMATGWVKAKGQWYYLSAEGPMVVNADITYKGTVYHFNADGICTNP